MKNKREETSGTSGPKLATPLKHSLDVKNREQLRKKLKSLLDKDKKNKPDVKLVENMTRPRPTSKAVQVAQNPTSSKNAIKPSANNANSTKPKKNKKGKSAEFSGGNKTNGSTIGPTLKRKATSEVATGNKSTKLKEKSAKKEFPSFFDDDFGHKKKKSNQDKEQKVGTKLKSNLKHKPEGDKNEKSAPQKAIKKQTKLKSGNIPKEQVREDIKVAKKAKNQSPEKSATKNVKKSKKTQKAATGSRRGPLPPNASESESDQDVHFDLPPAKSKKSKRKGPIRPTTTDSESDEDVHLKMPPNKKKKSKPKGLLQQKSFKSEGEQDLCVGLPHKKQKKSNVNGNITQTNGIVVNNEQALTRVSQKDELSDDDEVDSFSFGFEDSIDNSVSYESGSFDDSESDADDVFIDSDDCDDTYSLEDSASSPEMFSYYDSDSDRTYELPQNVAEDVIIANGTAIKHDLSESNEVGFDSDTSSAQIIELPEEPQVKQQPQQPKSTASRQKQSSPTKKTKEHPLKDRKLSESEDSCPELVPIDFKTHYHSGNGSDCCSDCSLFSDSEYSSFSENSNYSEISEYSSENTQMKPEIFQANNTKSNNSMCVSSPEDFDILFLHKTNDTHFNYAAESPLELITKSKGKSSSYKVITTHNKVVDPEPKAKKIKIDGSEPVEENSLSCPDADNDENTKTDKAKETLEEETVKSFDNPFNAVSRFTEKDYTIPNSADISIETAESDQIENLSVEPSKLPIKTSENSQLFETPAKVSAPKKKSSEASKKSSLQNSSFRTLFFNAVNSNHVIVLLKGPLYIYGTVKLKLLAGSVDIFGYNPKRNEVVEIFSPRGYSSLKIEACNSSLPDECLSSDDLLSLTTYFIRTDLEEVVKQFDAKKDAIVLLERNDRSKKVNMLRKYMVDHLFPNMNALQSDRPFFTSEFLLRCIITTKTDKALIIDPHWRGIKVTNNSRVMVIGGKSVGKSTLTRYLINRNLTQYPKVLLIDLDIGQPEMFVPQTVSATSLTQPLLGPGYFLNKEPDKAFLVGQTNVVLVPRQYIENVKALMEYCKETPEYRDIPWIINTMGYNKGFGDEIIAVICNLIHPTNLIQLESNRDINNFDVIMSKENIESMESNIIGDMFSCGTVFRPQHQLTLMTSVIPNDRKYQSEWDMKPRDMRLANIVCRLSNILREHAEWLTDVKPVCASTDKIKIITFEDDEINSEDLLQTLVGNLVYLCHTAPGNEIECLGIGIVRGIDYPLKQIYLLPAAPLEILEHVNCLAVCSIPLPSSILINQGPKVKGLASYVYNTVDIAASMHVKQMYNRPQHFLTGRHRSIAQ